MGRFRRWLLLFIAQGDLVVCNAQIDSGGVLRPTNAGDPLLANLDVWGWDKLYGIAATQSSDQSASIKVAGAGRQQVCIHNATVKSPQAAAFLVEHKQAMRITGLVRLKR